MIIAYSAMFEYILEFQTKKGSILNHMGNPESTHDLHQQMLRMVSMGEWINAVNGDRIIMGYGSA